NWLDQFTMRAGRVVPNRPRAEQTAWVYGLNDRAMRQYVNAKRREAERAVKMRADEEDPTQGSNLGGGGLGPQLLYNGVELEGISGIGFDHNGYLAELEEEDDEFAHLTDKEKREALRRRRQGLANQYAAKLYGSVNGETIRKANGLLIARYGKSVNQCTPEELAEQIVWLENELGLNAESVQVQEDTYEEEPFFVQQGLFGDDEMMG
ncbi:MAG: hypothetical protein KDD84_08265, partial [Caldilineaceae bacterium]|nr:hypothetical protein [Caldilineaceae bacterium]